MRKGETLATIASRYGVTVTDIKRWNRLKTSSVRRGTRLKIRTGEASVGSAESLAADSLRVASIHVSPAKSRRGHSGPVKMVVTVRAGDTLGTIASRHGPTVAKLKSVNGLTTSRVRAGQRLKIPA